MELGILNQFVHKWKIVDASTFRYFVNYEPQAEPSVLIFGSEIGDFELCLQKNIY